MKIPDFLYPWLQRLARLPYLLVYGAVCLFHPVKPNTVIFICTRGLVLHDNLRYIRDALNTEIYSTKEFFTQARGFRGFMNRLRLAAEIAHTEYTLIDDVFPMIYVFPIRRGARLIQVWHALGAMKRMGFSCLGKPGGTTPTTLTHRNYTDTIVSSDEIRPLYAEAYGVDLETVHPTGVPRSDLFFDEATKARVRADLFAEFPVLKDRRVILFAPTFRSGGDRGVHYPQEYLNLDLVATALGDKDLFVIKMHPFVRQRWEIPQNLRDQIVDLSDYPEFNNLLLVSDLLITDYSSAIFDNALLRKPVVFYTPDFEQYDDWRGFYYPFEAYTYGPVVTDLESLLTQLGTTTIDEQQWSEFHERFLNRCGGNATQRLVDTIFVSRLRNS
ncbi:MAG: CDP-glycerol glycerophosphotransferase family protein [Propionibacteriaceae bacterium]|nr:CDP-glycerol glycerophosphotransferase family protein [Propionibacteriaceae bacterium]